MLIKKRYSFIEVLLWTRYETGLFILYASFVAFLYQELNLFFLHVPWTPLALIGTAVAFVIGFQNNAAYGRTWEARKIWGGIVNASRTFGMKVQGMVRPEGEISKEEIKTVHKVLIHRHIAWLTALRFAMREPRLWEETNGGHRTNSEWRNKINIPEHRDTLQNEITNYLPLSELTYVMSKKNKASTILYLQSRHLRKLKESGVLWEFSYLNLMNVLEELFTLQGKSERIKNFPYPRQYATISHYFIWLFLLMLPFGLLPEFKEIGMKLSLSLPGMENLFVWLAIPFCAIVSWVFHTMERIGRVGENPFEGTPNDVPISTISRGIEIDIRQQLNEPNNVIPEGFSDDNHVQM